MTTSGSTDYSRTARQLITGALEDAGIIAVGETPAAEQATKAQSILNNMLKTWGTDEKLWIRTEGTQALSASTGSYVLSAARRVISVRRRTSSVDTPLYPMSREEYDAFPAKSASGMPHSYYFDPQRATRTLYVINVPDATIAASTSLVYTYLRALEDIDALDDDLDVPQEWIEACQANLAARLYVPFRRHLVDPNGYADTKDRATTLYAQLSGDSEETASIYFQPSFHH